MKKSISKGTAKKENGVVMGMDLGDRFSRYAVIDANATIIEEGRVPTEPASIEKLLEGRPPMRVVIETSTQSPWVSRLVQKLGHEAVVANSRKVKLISQSKNKRDRVDARMLTRLGRADVALLSPVRHRSEVTQQRRAWLLARDTAVQSRTKLINHVRGIVKSLGHRLPSCSAEAFLKKAVPSIPQVLEAALSPLPVIEAADKAVRLYDQELEALSKKHYPITDRLQQIKGVGPITALAYVLTLEDPSRFRHSRSVGAYLGLVPGTSQSGEHDPQMHITKEGDVMMRRLLVSAAQYILGRFGPECDLRSYGQRIAQRGGKIAKRRAVVAVARKLAVLLHKLWTDQVDYDPRYASKRLQSQSQAA
ncbi:MAG: transposase [Thermoanaerobaculia bacterium]|jgi:transposase|nr:transposase [Thermoanaerobaculia bacterium]